MPVPWRSDSSAMARAVRGVDAFVIAVGMLSLGLLAYVILRRIGYPFGLEWMEGGSLDHVRRILAGEKIYVPPSVEFVPFFYTPLYFYVSAAFAWILGPSFLSLRMVSVAASAGCLLAIFLFARRLAGSSRPALLSVCFFAACYQLSGAWLDLARVDSLFLLLLLLAIVVQRTAETRGSFLLAGLLLALAVLTKQTAMVIALPLMVHAVVFHPRRSPWLLAGALGLVGGSTLALDLVHHGWYLYYVLLPWKAVGEMESTIRDFLVLDVLQSLPVLTALVAWLLWSRRRIAPRSEQAFDLMLLFGIFAGCFVSRTRSGGYVNVLLPLHAVLAAYAGPAAQDLASRLWGTRWRICVLGVQAALLLQFALVAYAPTPLIPSRQDLEAGKTIVNLIAATAGDVMVPFHAYLAERAGKRGAAYGNAGGDVLKGDDGPVGQEFMREFRQAIREQRFAAIYLDDSDMVAWTGFGQFFGKDLDAFYEGRTRLQYQQDAFWPRSGVRTRPDVVFVPR